MSTEEVVVIEKRKFHESLSEFPCYDLETCDLGFCKVGRILVHYRAEVSSVKHGIPSNSVLWGRGGLPAVILPGLNETDFPTCNLTLDEAHQKIEDVNRACGFFSLLGKIWDFTNTTNVFDIDPYHLFAYLENFCQSFDIKAIDESEVSEPLETYSTKICKLRSYLIHHNCMWAGQCSEYNHYERWDLFLSPPLKKPDTQSLLKQSSPNYFVQSHEILLQSLYKVVPSDDVNAELLAYEIEFLRRGLPLIETDDEEDEIELVDMSSTDSGEQEEEEETVKTTEADTVRNQLAAANDHSYHKRINSTAVMASYGIDTPSDSEEDEIDVVSFSSTKSGRSQLPTELTSQECQQWQQTVATAITKSTIKTIMPVQSEQSKMSAGSSRSKGKRIAKNGSNKRAGRGTKRKRKHGESKTPVDKRDQHNDMERQRRVGLRVAYDHLKDQLPYEIRSKKISKVSILIESTKYANNLTATEANLQEEIQVLKNARRQMQYEKNELIRYFKAQQARQMQ